MERNRVKRLLQATLLLSVAVSQVTSQISTTYSPYQPAFRECCEMSLMDANRQVGIETERTLPVGTFQAMRMRLCTMDPVSVQIWTRVSALEYRFKWQHQFTPSVDQINRPFTTVNIQHNPVTIGPPDRLAVYNPSNGSLKIPLPYDTDPLSAAQYFSRNTFTGSQFVLSQTITLDDLKWPRTFGSSLTFCATASDCPDEPSTVTPPVGPGVGPPGPPGPPGQCCPVSPGVPVNCDPSGSIQRDLTNQNEQVKRLEADINRLLLILNNLRNSSVVTGICPQGFISGVYGVGSCYIIHRDEKIQLAQAAIMCRDIYSAELVRLESEAEDSFLRNFILNITSPAAGRESFWTAGMYNIPLRNWYWYSDNTRIKAPYTYRNWLDGREPAARTIYDVCSVFSLDVPTRESYWEKRECTTGQYYICEVPKKCL